MNDFIRLIRGIQEEYCFKNKGLLKNLLNLLRKFKK